MGRRKRRRFTVEEKLRILEEARRGYIGAGVSLEPGGVPCDPSTHSFAAARAGGSTRPDASRSPRGRPRTVFLAAVGALAAAGALAAGACGGDGGDDGLALISHVLPEGRNGAWRGEKTAGVYWMTNTTDPGTIHYYFVDPAPGTEGRRTAGVEIAIDSIGEGTRAGMVYGVHGDRTTYYFYLVEHDGRVFLFRREPDATWTELASGRTERRPGEFVALALEEREGRLDVLVDGARLGTVRDAGVGRGGIGIAAGGTGRFGFTNFRHDPAPLLPEPVARLEGGPGAWRTHETRGVFTLDHPEGWEVAFDDRRGIVTATGDRGEAVWIWPLHAPRPLDHASALALLGQLASRVVPGMTWSPGEAVGPNAVRAVSRDGSSTLVASLQWFSNRHGSAVFGYVARAPSERYAEETATLSRVLASFRPSLSGEARAAAPSRPSTRFTAWRDPVEGAFHADVPAGWRVDGRLARHTALDVRRGMRLTSPDGEVSVFHMDPEIPYFTLPDQTTAALGMREGTWYTAPDGSRMLIGRYVPGLAFAQEYVDGRLAAGLTDVRIETRRERPDLARVVAQEYRALNQAAAGFVRLDATAGEVFFTGRRDGRDRTGYAVATTVVGAAQMGGVWEVRELYGLLAPPERVGEAAAVLERLVSSFRWDPGWYMRQYQTRVAVGEIMQDYGRTVSGIIEGTFATASRAADRSADRYSEYIRGSVTVEDEQGRRFEVWNTSNYYWMDAFDDVTGTVLSPNPDVSRFRELIVVR